MKVLVTGTAGFIGSALAMNLLQRGDTVIGIDNHNNYYDPRIKEARLNRHLSHPNYRHIRETSQIETISTLHLRITDRRGL